MSPLLAQMVHTRVRPAIHWHIAVGVCMLLADDVPLECGRLDPELASRNRKFSHQDYWGLSATYLRERKQLPPSQCLVHGDDDENCDKDPLCAYDWPFVYGGGAPMLGCRDARSARTFLSVNTTVDTTKLGLYRLPAAIVSTRCFVAL